MTPPSSDDGLMTGLAVNPGGKSSLGEKMHGSAHGSLIVLFWVAIGFQAIDVFMLQYDRTVFFATSIALYGALIGFAIWAFSQEEGHLANPKEIAIFILISAFYIIVPSFFYILRPINFIGNLSLFFWVSFLLAITPIWPIYVGLKANIPFVHKYINIWIVGLLLLFIFGVGFNLNPGDVAGIGGRPELLQAGAVANYLMEKTADVAKNFWNSLSLIPAAKRLLNSSGINYYTGMIDNNEDAPVGLYLTNVRLADKYAYVGYPAIVWADIRGKSFNEEIIVTPSCYIDKKGDGVPQPSYFSILGEEHDTLSCTFNDLEKGTYRAKVGAAFNFETWAYVTYTFVDIDTKRALEIQGKNVNHELDVDPLPRAVFTNGPVMLGMASMVDQPIGIDTEHNTKEPVLGVTLDNLWTEGEIERVDEFIIQVPEDLKLVKCDRWHPDTERDPFKTEDGYSFYKFSREEIGDPRASFQSVTCRLSIKEPKEFLAGAQKVQKTFVAQAKYLYKIEKSVSIYVRE